MNLAQATRVGLAIANKKQSWLADELNVTKVYVSRVCCGTLTPSVDRIEEIATVFGVDSSTFVKWGELKLEKAK